MLLVLFLLAALPVEHATRRIIQLSKKRGSVLASPQFRRGENLIQNQRQFGLIYSRPRIASLPPRSGHLSAITASRPAYIYLSKPQLARAVKECKAARASGTCFLEVFSLMVSLFLPNG